MADTKHSSFSRAWSRWRNQTRNVAKSRKAMKQEHSQLVRRTVKREINEFLKGDENANIDYFVKLNAYDVI